MNVGHFYGKKIEKKSHNAEKTEREDPFGFFNIHFVAKREKNERGTLWWKKSKSRTMPKKFERGNLLVSPGNVCYAEKKKNLFSLVPWAGQQVKFEIL